MCQTFDGIFVPVLFLGFQKLRTLPANQLSVMFLTKLNLLLQNLLYAPPRTESSLKILDNFLFLYRQFLGKINTLKYTNFIGNTEKLLNGFHTNRQVKLYCLRIILKHSYLTEKRSIRLKIKNFDTAT